MAIYESATYPREKLEELRKRNVCAVCSQPLWLFLDMTTHKRYISCSNQAHNGIAREFQTEQTGLNIKIQGEVVEQAMTTNKNAAALAKYVGIRELARNEAKEIIESLFPAAPDIEKERAILTCISYKLNPLSKHVFLIPFNKGKENETWALVMGIKAKRLLANRPVPGTKEPRPFSYIDDTPRKMTEAEQIKIYSEVQVGQLMTIVKLKDPKTGAEVPGYGAWPLTKKVWRDKQQVDVANEPYGSDKGNTMFNMSSIHAESQALDRLRPGEMPENVETVDEATLEGEYRLVDAKTGEIQEPVSKQEAEPSPKVEEVTASDIEFDKLESASNKLDVDWAVWTIATLQKKGVAALQREALSKTIHERFLPAGTTPEKMTIKALIPLLSPEKAQEFAKWLQDLEAKS